MNVTLTVSFWSRSGMGVPAMVCRQKVQLGVERWPGVSGMMMTNPRAVAADGDRSDAGTRKMAFSTAEMVRNANSPAQTMCVR